MRSRRVAFYIRLSDSDEEVKRGIKEESNSISGQRELLISFVKKNKEFQGFEIQEYFDDGFSGTLFQKREQFQRMISDAQKGVFECLIVKDFSRLGRDYLEVGNYMEYIFPAIGLRFISVNDNYDSNKNYGMTGGMNVAFKNLIYQMYSRDVSKKIKSALRTRNLNGEYTASFAKYGYKKDPQDYHKLVVDEAVAPYIKEIFEKVADGISTLEIARMFNQRKVPTKLQSQRGKSSFVPHYDKGDDLWYSDTVLKIVRDEIYIGKLIQNKFEIVGFGETKKAVKCDQSKWAVVENAVPAIVSKELFVKANAQIHTRVGIRRTDRVNLFTCPYCGRKLMPRSGNSTRLRCAVRALDKERPCADICMKVTDVEKIVVESVKRVCTVHLSEPDSVKTEKQDICNVSDRIKMLEEEKEQLKGKIIAGYREYRANGISREDYIAARETVNKKVEEIEGEIRSLEEKEQAEPEMPEVEYCDWEKIMEQVVAGYDGRKFSQIIEKVLVYGDNTVEVVFKGNEPVG